MPPRRGVPALQGLASREVSRQVLEELLGVERQQAGLEGPRAGGSSNTRPAVPTIRIPTRLRQRISDSSHELYRERYHRISSGLRVWVLTRGVGAPELYARLQPGPSSLEWSQERTVRGEEEEEVTVPILRSLLATTIDTCLAVLSFRQLSLLDSVGQNVFDEFKQFLSATLPLLKCLQSLDLASHNSRNSLPQCTDEHLALLGLHCHQLHTLDVSFNKGVTGEGLRRLLPGPETQGCPDLTRLLIFDCAVFEKEVAKALPSLPHLEYLGYKETGKVVKSLHKSIEEGTVTFRPLLLTHVDNLGSKARRLIASTLRCKKPVALAVTHLCPAVRNLKVRVADDDCNHLAGLEKLEALELVYHVGSLGSPGPGTASLLETRGGKLTALTLKCHSLTMSTLTTVAETCPGLAQLWARCNHLLAPPDPEESVVRPHHHLANLHTLYFRVGENELAVTQVPPYVLPFLLRNTGKRLRELILAVRSSLITDQYICGLITDFNLRGLEKVLVVVPGLNSLPGILKLHAHTVQHLLVECPGLKKLGNLLSWSLEPEEIVEMEQTRQEMNWDLEIVNKKMTMR